MKDVERYTREANIQTNDAADREVLHRMHRAYEESARLAEPGRCPDYLKLLLEWRPVRLAAAALILLAVAVLLAQFGNLLTGGGVAWAEVTQRFQSVPFFYASIYMRDNALAQPRQFELWMGKGGRTRMRVGSQVLFGRDGKVTHAFDIRQRRPVEPDETAADIIALLATPAEFSLETVIRSLSGGKLTDVTPAMNAHGAIGEDLALFDAQSAVSPGWVRIYALRESRLPVALKIWDPAEGFGVDAMITYATEPHAIVFDPEPFAARLQDADATDIDLAYLFLDDPGGLDVTPNDLLTIE